MRLRPLALPVLCCALLLCPAAARADGDPASDFLLQQDAYYPYAPKTSPALHKALDGLLRRARAAGYPMKVALIASSGDLGSYPQLFSDPQRYADLLAQELSTITHGHAQADQLHLLVVTPSGFAGSGLGDKVNQALAPVSVDASAQSDGLAQAALQAAARVATANGHRLAVPPEATAQPASGQADKGSGTSPAVYVVPILLVVAGALGGALLVRRRRATPRP